MGSCSFTEKNFEDTKGIRSNFVDKKEMPAMIALFFDLKKSIDVINYGSGTAFNKTGERNVQMMRESPHFKVFKNSTPANQTLFTKSFIPSGMR